MSKFIDPRLNSQISPVVLSLVNDSYYSDFTLEPSMVRQRAANSSYLYLDSNDINNRNDPPVNCVVSTPGDGTMMRKVKRIGLSFLEFTHNTPVINLSNNQLQIFNSRDNRVYTANIKPGNYNTPQKLIVALNTAIVNSGITVVAQPIAFTFYFRGAAPPFPQYTIPDRDNYVSVTTDYPVYFLSDSSAVKRGLSTFGFPIINGPIWGGDNPTAQAPIYLTKTWTTMMIGPMYCTYTRYVDFLSTTITNWTKLPTASTKGGSNSLFYRLYTDYFQHYPVDPGALTIASPIIYMPQKTDYRTDVHTIITQTYNPEENINTVDIQVRDEYGQPFVENPAIVLKETTPGDPTTQLNNPFISVDNGGINWDIAFYCEI